jgi:hypothetical protein
MNIDNINLLADTIEDHAKRKEGLRGEIGFNMDYIFFTPLSERAKPKDNIDSCGTVACLAGWAGALAQPKASLRELNESEQLIRERAEVFLGLPSAEAGRLFYPSGVMVSWGDITPKQAVRVLRHLAKTGKVDWSKRGRP